MQTMLRSTKSEFINKLPTLAALTITAGSSGGQICPRGFDTHRFIVNNLIEAADEIESYHAEHGVVNVLSKGPLISDYGVTVYRADERTLCDLYKKYRVNFDFSRPLKMTHPNGINTVDDAVRALCSNARYIYGVNCVIAPFITKVMVDGGNYVFKAHAFMANLIPRLNMSLHDGSGIMHTDAE